ncbi:MAG: TonB family protein [Candidatus Binatia bacterium]
MSQASSTFGHYGATEETRRPWFSAGIGSIVLYIGIIAGALAIGVGQSGITKQEQVDVKFVEQIQKPEEPPKVEPKPPPPPPPKAQKAQPKKAVEAPKELPKEVPAEAEPVANEAPSVWIPSDADYAAGFSTAGGVRKEIREDDLPGAVRARPMKGNEPPPYPKTARNAGKQASVTLKIRITTDGRVEDIEVVEGEEPFTTSAIDTVKRWRYSPASYQGKPISVYRIIKIAFQLS